MQLMHIINNTPTELCLQSRRNLVSMLMGGLFMVMSIGIGVKFLSFLGATTITCQRPTPTSVECRATRSRAFGLWSETSPLVAQVREAQLRHTETPGDGDDCETYRDDEIVLRTAQEHVVPIDTEAARINCVRGDAAGMLPMVNRLNAFFASTEPTVTVTRNAFWRASTLFALGVISLFVLGGAGILRIGAGRTTVRLKRASNQAPSELLWERSVLWGTQHARHTLRDIRAVAVNTETDSDGMEWHELTLKLRDGVTYRLGGGGAATRDEIQTLQHHLQRFLGLPEELAPTGS